MQQVEDRDPGQEGDVGSIEIGQQQVDEPVVQHPALRRRHRDLRLRVAAGGHDRHGELQAERPAFGQLVQARGGVAVDARAEAPAHQLDRLVEPEAQLGRADARRAAVGDQVVDLELAVGARRDHGAQVGRRVAQQVRQRVAGRRRQPIGLVDDQDDVERRMRDLGEPDRHAFEPGRHRCLEQGVAEGGAAGGGADRQRQALHEARSRRRSAAPTTRPPPCPAPDARVATGRAATSCRSRPAPAPGSPGGRAGVRGRT